MLALLPSVTKSKFSVFLIAREIRVTFGMYAFRARTGTAYPTRRRARSGLRYSMASRRTLRSARKPPMRGASWSNTTCPVLATDFRSHRRHHGCSVRKSITSTSAPSLHLLGAGASVTMAPNVMMETCLPSRATAALPSGTSYAPFGISCF